MTARFSPETTIIHLFWENFLWLPSKDYAQHCPSGPDLTGTTLTWQNDVNATSWDVQVSTSPSLVLQHFWNSNNSFIWCCRISISNDLLLESTSKNSCATPAYVKVWSFQTAIIDCTPASFVATDFLMRDYRCYSKRQSLQKRVSNDNIWKLSYLHKLELRNTFLDVSPLSVVWMLWHPNCSVPENKTQRWCWNQLMRLQPMWCLFTFSRQHRKFSGQIDSSNSRKIQLHAIIYLWQHWKKLFTICNILFNFSNMKTKEIWKS